MKFRSCLWVMAVTIALGGCARLPWQQECVCARTDAAPKPASRAAVPAVVPPAGAEPEPTQEGVIALPPAVQLVEQWQNVSDAVVARQISDKLRRNLKLPKGSFPKTAEVTLEAVLAPTGYVLGPRIARTSGYKALDQAVLAALKRAQPLPVTASIKESDTSQTLRLVFRPLAAR
ncbi:TonB family protein [Uliginosibacterium sp. 31-16]|uniref:TonB family protein n=1 Tax=Uliginosibacterium sp. 31-16 TaxID=3068315 RepID=UPI00273F9BF6|nr:TonB family protein [Uliginosibacterium sp. 31-16]MDP5241035.1 TonB family protein [Uliginosibacterium sp. 31-16]